MKLRHFVSIALVLFGGATSRYAFAQSAAAAEALFQEGQAALERSDFETACPKLRESDRLDPANGTKLNLADCEEKRGHLASAWELYKKLADTLPAGDERLGYSQQRAQALASRVPHLTFKLAPGAPPETQVSLGTVVFGSASFGTALPVDPGAHQIVVSAGANKRTYQLNLAEAENTTLEISPLADAAAPAPAATPVPTVPPPSPPAPVKDRGKPLNTRTLGFVLGGVGVVGLGVGAITGIIGLNHQATGDENCSDVRRVCNQLGADENDKARAMRPVSMAGFAIGIVSVGVGAYFVLTSRSDRKVALGGHVNADAALVDVSTRW